MQNDIKEVLLTEEDIANKCVEIGKQLSKEYKDKFPLLIGVLKGATPFMADLSRHINTHVEMDFMDVSSYGSGTRSRSEEHTSELQSRGHLVCRLLLEKKKDETKCNNVTRR